MTSREEAVAIFQDRYFDLIDEGDGATAAEILRADVDWTHLAAWRSDELGFARSGLDAYTSRRDVAEFLSNVAPKVIVSGLRHLVQDLVIDGDRGAFLCEVTSTKKPDVAHFMVWFELDGGQVARYVMRPL